MTGEYIHQLGVGELKRKLEGGEEILIVDVRDGDEFAAAGGHIPGARNLPLAKMPAVLEEIADAKKAPIAVNCGSSGRSERAARLMTEAGFRRVSVIHGGLAAWREAGFSTA